MILTRISRLHGVPRQMSDRTVSLEQFAINSARQQFVSESVQWAAEDVSLRSWTITNTIQRCWGVLWSWRRL